MRGADERRGSLFSDVDVEARVGKDHPPPTIRGVANEALATLSGEFSALRSRLRRPSIPPGEPLREAAPPHGAASEAARLPGDRARRCGRRRSPSLEPVARFVLSVANSAISISALRRMPSPRELEIASIQTPTASARRT